MEDCLNRRYAINGRVVMRTIGEDTLLVPVSGDVAGVRVFPLNETAEVVWRCLSDGGSVREAAEALMDCYDVSLSEAQTDSEECVRVLLDERLIERIA